MIVVIKWHQWQWQEKRKVLVEVSLSNRNVSGSVGVPNKTSTSGIGGKNSNGTRSPLLALWPGFCAKWANWPPFQNSNPLQPPALPCVSNCFKKRGDQRLAEIVNLNFVQHRSLDVWWTALFLLSQEQRKPTKTWPFCFFSLFLFTNLGEESVTLTRHTRLTRLVLILSNIWIFTSSRPQRGVYISAFLISFCLCLPRPSD